MLSNTICMHPKGALQEPEDSESDSSLSQSPSVQDWLAQARTTRTQQHEDSLKRQRVCFNLVFNLVSLLLSSSTKVLGKVHSFCLLCDQCISPSFCSISSSHHFSLSFNPTILLLFKEKRTWRRTLHPECVCVCVCRAWCSEGPGFSWVKRFRLSLCASASGQHTHTQK